MPEDLNENPEIVEGGSEPQEDLDQIVLDLQSEIMVKDSQIEELKQQMMAFDEIKSDKLFKEVELVKIGVEELRTENIPLLSQKLQEYVYFAGKTDISRNTDGVKSLSVNEQKKTILKQEINSLLKELGNLELK